MSRLLLSSVLVALVFGLTLLVCIPIESEWMGNVGDEFQITDDAVVQHDPVFYNTVDYYFIEEAQIAYHDGSSIYVYDIASKSTEILYSSPVEYTITAMTTVFQSLEDYRDLVFTLNGNNENLVIRETDGEFEEIYRDSQSNIDNICATGDYGYEPRLYLERDGEIMLVEGGAIIDTFEGIEPCEDSHEYGILFIKEKSGSSDLYSITHYGGETYEELVFSNDSNLHNPVSCYSIGRIMPREYYYIVSDYEGDIDICGLPGCDRIFLISGKDGIESDLHAWHDFVVYTRTSNGKTDVYFMRGGDEDY